MPLTPGTMLGAYEVIGLIGQGGMGIVYRARDTKLDRDVALKVLPDLFADDPERLARFQREAKVLASLNHPNIASIYGLEESEGVRALVLELVEGPTLAERIAQGAIPVDEALPIARQIAEALEAAHEAGVIHRDLKPANVKVKADGMVKVLDFGLAKALKPEPAGDPSESPTMTAAATKMGVIMGTAAYMSPEQARGKPVDKRSDIWAFGCLMFEVLTGRRAFDRETVTDTLAAVIEVEPSWEMLPAAVPTSVQRLLRRCLRKDPLGRLRDIGEARIEIGEARIEEPSDSTIGQAVASPAVTKTRVGGLGRYVGVAALVVAALLVGYLASGLRPTTTTEVWNTRQITRQQAIESQPSLSPDGQFIVYTSDQRGNHDIYWQLVDGQNVQNLTESSDADDYQPAFSPDGTRIAFRSDRGAGGIYVMGTFGENPRPLINRGFDPAWSPDGEWVVFSDRGIFDPLNLTVGGLAKVQVTDPTNVIELYEGGYLPAFSPNGYRIAYFDVGDGGLDIFTISSDGADPVHVTDDTALDWAPAWAPDGRRLYFSSTRGGLQNIWWIEIDEASGVPEGEPQRVSVSEADHGWLSVSDDGLSIAYTARREPMNLQRVAFDPESRQIVGTPESITSGTNSVIRFDISPDGESLVYSTQAVPDLYLISADGNGAVQQLTDDEYFDFSPRFSPDGRHIVYVRNVGGSVELWRMDLESRVTSQLTRVGEWSVLNPVLSPDGSRLLYHVTTDDDRTNYIMPLDQEWESQTPEVLPNPGDDTFQPNDWSPNGRWIVGWTDSQRDPRLLLLDPESREYEVVGDFRGHAHPAWLGDDYLVFVGSAETRGVATRREEMLLMDRRTGETELLLNDGPDWTFEEQMVASPDGRWLYFIRQDLESDIWLLSRER